MATIIAAPLTIDDFSRLSRDGERHEMSAGELIVMPPPKFVHSRIAINLALLIAAALEKFRLSEVFTEAGYLLSRNPLTIRQPDVSVLSKKRVESIGKNDYAEGAPELAVEVVSPSDSAQDLQVKINHYLMAGAKQVWVLYPETKCVNVFYPVGQGAMFDETQTLTGGDLVPGFTVKISDLFL